MDKNISFIHLSDIHFTKFSGDLHDLDDDLRNEILRDIKENVVATIGQPAGILVCGDIAFSGKAVEYKAADKFLRDMCDQLGISSTSVLCVPGNHDVDQEVLKESELLMDSQKAIENASDIDEKLAACFRDRGYKDVLFSHVHEYNSFSAKFRCNLSIPNKKFNWQQDFTLNDGSTLRIRGLNSIVISSHLDTDERRMVLGHYQIPQREEGVAYVSLCHHPPECWKDSDTVATKLQERVCVQLYGHKHIQRIRKIDNSLILSSGATHPKRAEKRWKPCYNWIEMCVEGSGEERSLKTRIYPRILNDSNDRFIPDRNSCGNNLFVEYTLQLEKWEKNNMQPPVDENEATKIVVDDSNEIEQKKISNPIRILVYRFLELSFITRTVILSELGLINEEDEGIEHVELLDRILQEAQEKKVLDQLWDKVNCAHDNGAYKENPFKEKI